MKRKNVFLIWSSVVIGIFFIITFFSISYMNKQEVAQNFDVNKWNNSPPTSRLSMAKHLVTERILYGKSKKEVKELLGDNGLARDEEHSLCYIVGENIADPWVLDITIDESGMVKEYLVRDG